MSLIQARNRLLEIMRPFQLHLYSFKVESTVGYDLSGKDLGAYSDQAKGGNWQQDMIYYHVEANTGTDFGKYPRSIENSASSWNFRADGTDLDNVFASIEQQALTVVPVWQRDLDLDAELRSHVGQRFITLKQNWFRVAKKNPTRRYETRSIDVAVGLCGKVVGHRPGFLQLEFDKVYDAEDQLRTMWMPQHQVNSYYTRCTTKDLMGPTERVPDPYIRFES